MAFLEDPRFRQRWNQISHNAETVTENAAAGIWSVQHNYINPCLASLAESLDHCTAVCLGDREERARRRRERQRARRGAEYSFDFYDDWYQEEDSGPGILGGWSYEDWDRLLAGSGSSRHRAGLGGGVGSGEVSEQPRRKRGMSYGGTRAPRRKPPAEDDPTVIPSTQPIGFLGRLPWKIGGTLRYKPSAADLQEHPGHHGMLDENAPLLGGGDEGGYYDYHAGGESNSAAPRRKRSSTTGSGGTSDSYRSRGDLFPSDGEEDAVPLDDEFTLPPDRVDDRSSNRTRSSKGKRPAGSRPISRTVSRTTVASGLSGHSNIRRTSTESMNGFVATPSIEHLRSEEARIAQEEDLEIERKRVAAAQLAQQRGLSKDDTPAESDLKANPRPEEAFDGAMGDVTGPSAALHTARIRQDHGLRLTSKEEKPKTRPVMENRRAEHDKPDVDARDALDGLPYKEDDNTPEDPRHIRDLKADPGAKGLGRYPSSLERPATPVEDDFVPARLPRFR